MHASQHLSSVEKRREEREWVRREVWQVPPWSFVRTHLYSRDPNLAPSGPFLSNRRSLLRSTELEPCPAGFLSLACCEGAEERSRREDE